MNASSFARIETLNKDNYDTWKLQMQAVLMKNDAWEYVSGECVKPTLEAGNETSEAAVKAWTKNDEKAKSDIILSIKPSELKIIKGCASSREVWLKLDSTYQSQGPARKATLLKQLTLQRMEEGGDVREHVRKFHDTVDKLAEMNIDINPELLAIMLLYSLPPSFENFRCAIESRDELPSPETLQVKIIEESDARKNDTRGAVPNALMARRGRYPSKNKAKNLKSENKEEFKFRCHKCKEKGHKAADCKNKKLEESQPSAKKIEDVLLCAVEESSDVPEVFRVESSERDAKWCLDSGATSHLCGQLRKFVKIDDSKRGSLKLANRASTEIIAEGTVSFTADTDGVERNVKLGNVLHVPDLRENLLSVAKITDKNLAVTFTRDCAVVIDLDGNVKLRANRIGNLYYLSSRESSECHQISEDADVSTLKMWHYRLGHLNVTDLINAERNAAVRGLSIGKCEEKLECEICLRGKMTRAPFPTIIENRTKELLEIIHTDVCGPMRVESKSGARYFVTFIDDHSRWCEVRFIRNKSDVFNAFKEIKALVENQTGKQIKLLQSDNGREYLNKDFENFLTGAGIQRRLSIAYNPEQNGLAERKNRTLLETARCLLIQSGLPPSFWAEAVSTANFIRNRCPTKALKGRTPFESWTGKEPDVSNLREFGNNVYCLDRIPGKGKFEDRAKMGIFLGYASNSKGYRIWLPEEKKIEITRDVKFLQDRQNSSVVYEDFTPEDVTIVREEGSNSPGINNEETEIEIKSIRCNQGAAPEDDVHDALDDNADAEDTPRRGPGRPRILRTGMRGRPKKLFSVPHESTNITDAEFAHLAEVPIKKAISGPEAVEWYRAMAEEVVSILKNDTWKLVKRPDDREVIGSRMVLRNKNNPDGTLDRRKARIVAQGFAQRPGVHFNQTFAPVARLGSIRLLVALASNYGMTMRQLDVATAYLNGPIEEEVFMEPPQGLMKSLEIIVQSEGHSEGIRSKAAVMLEDLNKGNRVCLLKKSLYGLRQAGRNWYDKLDCVLRKYGAVSSTSDSCIYRIGKGKESLIIGIYVDDILMASRDSDKIEKMKNYLASEFEIRDLGEPKYCLGIEFTRHGNKIGLHQRGYIVNVLEQFGMSDCRPVGTPMDVNVKLSTPTEAPDEDEKRLPYRELIGALMYLATTTRPDIAYAVSALSQFNNAYGQCHWTAAKRVLRYLKGTADIGLIYEPSKEPLTGYVDADWAGCPMDRRSYSGYTFTLSSGVISWDSKKQRTVALSSTEAEYMGMTEAAKEAMHLRAFLIQLGFEELVSVTIFNDNKGAITLAESPTFHARSKHIDLKHHFIRDAIRENLFQVDYVSTDDMMADVMTKGLPKPKHRRCLNLMGLDSI